MDDVNESASTQAPGAGCGGIVPPVEHRFQKGQSGNPGGKNHAKPISAAMNRIAKMTEAEIEALVLRKDKTGAEVLALAAYRKAVEDARFLTHVLDRTEGKVPDQVKVEGGPQVLRIELTEATAGDARSGNEGEGTKDEGDADS